MFKAFETHDMAKGTIKTLISKIRFNMESTSTNELRWGANADAEVAQDVYELGPHMNCKTILGRDGMNEVFFKRLNNLWN